MPEPELEVPCHRGGMDRAAELSTYELAQVSSRSRARRATATAPDQNVLPMTEASISTRLGSEGSASILAAISAWTLAGIIVSSSAPPAIGRGPFAKHRGELLGVERRAARAFQHDLDQLGSASGRLA